MHEKLMWLDSFKGILGPSRAHKPVHFQFAYIFQKQQTFSVILHSHIFGNTQDIFIWLDVSEVLPSITCIFDDL